MLGSLCCAIKVAVRHQSKKAKSQPLAEKS
jgi:hypothetical protein